MEPWERARETNPPAQSAGLTKLGQPPLQSPSGSQHTPWEYVPSEKAEYKVKQEKATEKKEGQRGTPPNADLANA